MVHSLLIYLDAIFSLNSTVFLTTKFIFVKIIQI